MRMSSLRLVLAAFLFAAIPANAHAHTVFVGDRATQAHMASAPCTEQFSPKEYRAYARKVYQRPRVSKQAHARLRAMHICQPTFRARKRVGRIHATFKAAREFRKSIDPLTPYAGPNGTRWAIPWYIVACESGGSWSAYNPSGARGAYQFLGWNVPWPVRTAADRAAHHRMAARLWAGGAGASHWVCA